MGHSIWVFLLLTGLFDPFFVGGKMKNYKFKESMTLEQKAVQVDQLLCINSIADEQKRYCHIYRVLKMLNIKVPARKRLMSRDYQCTNRELIDNAVMMTDELDANEFETDSPFVDIYCTNHISNYISIEDDLILYQDKNGNKKYIKIEELHYYYFRLNKRLFSSGGYNTSTARNYFLSKGFKDEYKSRTNRSINPHKIAIFNRILNKYNLIKVYQMRKKLNLYVLGDNNPCYYFEGVMEAEVLKTVRNIINDNSYSTVNLTPKDKKIKQLEQSIANLKNELEKVKTDAKKFKNETEQNNATIADYHFVLDRNSELINENSQLKQQQEQIDKWSIAYKPVAMFNFGEKFEERLKLGPNRKATEVYVETDNSEDKYDCIKKLNEAVSHLEAMQQRY